MDALPVTSADFVCSDCRIILLEEEKSVSAAVQYPLPEFLQHLRALPTVRRYEYLSKGLPSHGEQVEIGSDNSDVGLNALRILDYFHQVYDAPREARQKGCLFLLMLMHLVKHRREYDCEHFAVFVDGDQPSMISLALLAAIHQHYTNGSINTFRSETALVSSIKATARKFRAQAAVD